MPVRLADGNEEKVCYLDRKVDCAMPMKRVRVLLLSMWSKTK